MYIALLNFIKTNSTDRQIDRQLQHANRKIKSYLIILSMSDKIWLPKFC